MPVLMIVIFLWVIPVTCYIRHLVWSFGMLTDKVPDTATELVLAALGTFAPPFGMIHGLLLFLGIV